MKAANMSRAVNSVLVAVVTVLISLIAKADKWALPKDKVEISPSSLFEVHLTQHGLEPASISMWQFHSEGGGQKHKLYEVRVVNRWSPVELAVSDSGDVLTVDDWHNAGGCHAAVVYDQRGQVIGDYSLEELLSQSEISSKISHSVSSRWWRSVGERPYSEDGAFSILTVFGETVRIKFEDGKVERDQRPFHKLMSRLRGNKGCGRAKVLVNAVGRVPSGGIEYCAIIAGNSTCYGHRGYAGLAPMSQVHTSQAAFKSLLRRMESLVPYIQGNRHVSRRDSLFDIELVFECPRAPGDQYRFIANKSTTLSPAAESLLKSLRHQTGVN